MSKVDVCHPDPPHDRWVSTSSGLTYPDSFQLGATIYTDSDIAAWTTGTEYTALLNRINGDPWSAGGNIGDITDYGTSIGATDWPDLRYISNLVKGWACLWAADGNATRLTDCQDFLNGMKDVTSWTGAAGQTNLEASWILVNAVQVAQIIGYDDTDFNTMLDDVTPTLGNASDAVGLDWWGSGNWNAGFAAAELHIASYRQDLTRWNRAVDYLGYHIKQGIYHSTYDGTEVSPVYSYDSAYEDRILDTTPNTTATHEAWRNETLQDATYDAEYSNHDSQTSDPWVYAGDLVDGTDCEAKRDLAHSVMTMSQYAMCEHICNNVGQSLNAHITDRIRANVEYVADRVLYYAVNASHRSNPVPEDGHGGVNRFHGWKIVERLYPGDVPTDVTSLVANSAYTSITAVQGDLAVAADRYADGTLL